ncbi:MAG: hypothetical protein JSU85_01690 [Candidatus Zixiibacteriota bacterium]|nr:MAG: hypothetical protein JSU85_01690 [candidate division Zixibacteria bacterium]
MITFAEYIKVGQLQQMAEKGWFKITFKGKVIIITFVENDPLAIEIFDTANPDDCSLPYDFHPDIPSDLEPLLDPPLESWGYLKTYPVKIEGDNILIGFNPLE